MPAAWCAARRAEIQAYVDGSGHRPAQQTRTHLIELLAQLQQMEIAHGAEKRLLIMRADSANWAAAELEVENKSLLNTIASRDQRADPFTEQYAKITKLIKLLATKFNIPLD